MVCLLYSVDTFVFNMWRCVARHVIHDTEEARQSPAPGNHSVQAPSQDTRDSRHTDMCLRGALMDPNKRLARRAGLLYWLHGLPAPFAYLYLPGVLLVRDDAVATADRVRASERLLRAGIIAELLGVTILIFAAFALYQLFKRVEPNTSMLMAVLMLVSVPISYINALNNIAPLVLLKSSAIASILDSGQVAPQVTLFLRLHAYGLVVAQIFWGLWLFPFGLLVMWSGFIPRWLAFPLFIAGTAYVLSSLGMLLLPPSLQWITQYAQILGVGEVPILVWLLIWGARSTVAPNNSFKPEPLRGSA